MHRRLVCVIHVHECVACEYTRVNVSEKNNGLLGNVTSRRSHPRRDASRDFMGIKEGRQEAKRREAEIETREEETKAHCARRRRVGGVKTVRVKNTYRYMYKMSRAFGVNVDIRHFRVSRNNSLLASLYIVPLYFQEIAFPFLPNFIIKLFKM